MNKNSIDNMAYFIGIVLIVPFLCLMAAIGIGMIIYKIQMVI